jgi:hypothetical protein
MDKFDKHLITHHHAKRPAEEQKYQIYDVTMIVSGFKDSQGGNVISNAQELAIGFVKERALELGKQGWLEDPWGHK